MASIVKRGDSYRIVVSCGRDQTGQQIRHTKTWTPDKGMTKKQVEKELHRVADDFERSIEQGFIADDRQTFAEYSQYVLGLKKRAGCKQKTLESYEYLLQRIIPGIGYLKLQDIRPAHLNKLYEQLEQEGIRNDRGKASTKDDTIPALLKSLKLSHAKAAERAGISAATVDTLCKGQNVSLLSAQKFCDAFDLDIKKTFNIEIDTSPLSAKSRLEYHRLIHTILQQAEKEMLVPYNAADKVTPPTIERKDPNYFQPDQISDILDVMESESIKWKTIVNLLVVTGCRRGEIASLKWSNVDFDHNKIKIDSTLLYSSGTGIFENATKTRDVRFLKLPKETMNLLRDYRQYWVELKFKNGDQWKGDDYVFVQDDGSVIFPDSITAYLNSLNVKYPQLPHINPHAFRHSVASVLIGAQVDPVTVSKRLGHSRVSTTIDLYSHLIAEADADASETIADTLLRRRA
ncbi:MAG: tyrosine-type recombinase/integrase [Oscillospiraceae bacterium]|nr:tyrosine-type recombinase/integrase [Oscillospiraceae bacterium]